MVVQLLEAGLLSAGGEVEGLSAVLLDAIPDPRDQLHLQPPPDREEHRRLARGDSAGFSLRAQGVAAHHACAPAAGPGRDASDLLRSRAAARRSARPGPVPDAALAQAR